MLLSTIFIIFVSALVTGFGNQPTWLFVAILLFLMIVTLPSCFSEYWVIKSKSLRIYTFSNYEFVKLQQLFNIKPRYVQVVKYDQIHSAKITYTKKKRNSPFDFYPDFFKIEFNLKDGTKISLNIDNNLHADLVDFVNLLNREGIDVYDKQHVLEVIQSGENLFEHFNAI